MGKQEGEDFKTDKPVTNTCTLTLTNPSTGNIWSRGEPIMQQQTISGKKTGVHPHT